MQTDTVLNTGCCILSSAGLKLPSHILSSVPKPVMEFPKWKHSGHFKADQNPVAGQVINDGG